MTNNTTTTTVPPKTADSNTSDDTATKQPQSVKSLPVDVNITGKIYTINCPADEVDELKSAATYINGFIHDIRKNAPQLTHENLLVLCCLNLYEKLRETEKVKTAKTEESKEAHALLDRMIKDMHIV